MTETLSNYSVREEIIAYWSDRAETFDQSFAHGITPGIESGAWARLIGKAIGEPPRSVLELACGTGEVTGVLLRLGYIVKGLDFAEPMLTRARAKHGANPAASFRLADAENTMEPDSAYDAVISRHLVWTLLNPEAAFADWLRVLKPGGSLVILDGNWSAPNLFGRIVEPVIAWLDRLAGRTGTVDPEMAKRHLKIMEHLPLRDGLTVPRLTGMLLEAGFVDVEQLPHRGIVAAQSRVGTLRDALAIRSHDYVFVRARRPE